MQYCRFKIYMGFLAFVLAFFAGAPKAYAQDAVPEVEIDWGVLQGLGQPAPAGNPQAQQPLSRPPVRQAWKPSLTPPPAPPQPQQVSRPVREASVPAAKPAIKPQVFPVQTKSRTESTNPALAPTKQIPVAAKESTASAVTPLPDEIMESAAVNIPVPPRKPETLKKLAAHKTPPLPKHRPNVQMASASFVAKARAQASQPQQNKAVKQDGPRVAAVPAGAVAAEPLKPTATPLPLPPVDAGADTDPLAQQIVSPSKNELIKAIDDIGKSKFAFFRKKEKPGRIDAQPLVKLDAVDITAEPATAVAGNDITEKLAAIEPAAADAAAEIPRPPPQEKYEEDYVSLKFAPGASEPDEKITAQIQGDVLSQLQANPGWRVQIQAFASPAGEGVSNARRISLSRALAIRTWLMGQGIEASRMDVRALGAESDRQPLDRVDMVLFDPKNG